MIRFFAYLVCYLLYPFSFLIPRTKEKMAFGSFRGAFNDNSKYLFIYAAESGLKDHICWLSINKTTVSQIRSLGLPAFSIFSPQGIWWALRSQYWFVNSYTSDILFCLSGGATVINLWHGVGLKRCEFNIKSGALAKRYVEHNWKEVYYHPESFRRPDYLLSSTPFQSTMFASAFRIPQSRCWEYGYPRNSILTKPTEEIQQFVKRYEPASTYELIQKCKQYSKVYIYMPTWRDSQLDVFAQHFDLSTLNAILDQQNALLLLKPHANTRVNNTEVYTNILFVDGKTDVYGILPFTDVLITDYSSILYDYILMPGKQVILYLYDYEEYVRDRDFYYPFAENVVGKMVDSFEDLVQTIRNKDYLIDENERQRLVDKFWGDTIKLDSCKVIFEKIGAGETKGIERIRR